MSLILISLLDICTLFFVYFWQNSSKPGTAPADPGGAAMVAGLRRGWLTQPGKLCAPWAVTKGKKWVKYSHDC